MEQKYRHRGMAFFKALLDRDIPPERRIGDDVFTSGQTNYLPQLASPVKLEYTYGVYVKSGSGSICVNMQSYTFNAPCLLIALSGQVASFSVDNRNELKIHVLILSDTFMNDLYSHSSRIHEMYTTLLTNPILRLDAAGVDSVDAYVAASELVITNVDKVHRLDSYKYLALSMFYGKLCTLFDNQKDSCSIRGNKISTDFISLLKDYYREYHKLDFYAQKLCITERYLYMTVKAVTGKTAGYWIDWYLLSESKVLLTRDNMSIQQISEHLHFASQSNFGKFFKRLTGTSPLAFRKSNL